MQEETLRQLSVGLIEAINSHDAERIASFYASEAEEIDIGQAAPKYGKEAVSQTLNRYQQAFPDFHFQLEETIVEGNRAVLIWIFRGTHLGTLVNIPPTNKFVEVRGVSVLTFHNDKITNVLRIWDTAGMLRSIGLLPEIS